MRYRILICVLLIFSLTIFSCSQEKKTNDEFIYPLSIGNTWEYTQEWNWYFYSDTTGPQPEYEDTLTYSSDISVIVTGEVLLNDTLETIEMIVFESDSVSTYTGKTYYKNNDDGLYIYAYKSGRSIIYPRKEEGTTIYFKGLEFDDYRQLSDFVQRLIPSYRILSDSLYFEDPPVKTLQYPIEIGDQWTYREDHNPWRMDRKVLDRKDVELSIGTFDCYEINFLYDMDHNGEWDDDILITDFISKEGLIQRIITLFGVMEADNNGPTGRLSDFIETYTLTDFSVH